jgi:hypothetical protein
MREAVNAHDKALKLEMQPELHEEEPSSEVRHSHLTVGSPMQNIASEELPSLFPPSVAKSAALYQSTSG